MKKAISLLTAVMLCFTVLAGCGKSDNDPKDNWDYAPLFEQLDKFSQIQLDSEISDVEAIYGSPDEVVEGDHYNISIM